MIGIIAAVTQNDVIGIDGKLPFDYPEDMAHFKKMTLNSIVIMGRITFEGIGKPLPKRTNIVISSKKINNERILTYPSVDEAMYSETILRSDANIWFIGGNRIYAEGMKYTDSLWLTRTPEIELSPHAIKFPSFNKEEFKLTDVTSFDNSPLFLERYERIRNFTV